MNFKDNKILMIGGLVVLLFLIVGFFLFKNQTPKTDTTQDEAKSKQIPKLTKEELDLSMELNTDDTKVKFTIGNASGIKSLEYEITYEADSTEDESVKVPKGITGSEEVDSDTFETDFLVMGTCSRNICKYDTGISDIKLLLKITKDDNQIYQAEDQISIDNE